MKTYNFPLIYPCIKNECSGLLVEKGKRLVCNVCKNETTQDDAIEAWLDAQWGL